MTAEINPQIAYFLNITELYYEKNFCKNQFSVFRSEFLRLIEENAEEMKDKLKSMHIVNPLFVISIHKSISEELDGDLDLLKTHIIDGLYGDIMAAYIENERTKFLSSDNPWKTYLDGVKKGNAYLYDNALFDFELVKDEPNEYVFHLNKCYYWDTFKRYNTAELGPILCEYDFLMAKNVDEWIDFSRENTIANGGLFCDFNAKPLH